ncbi:MAG: hypothetical protein GYB65_03365 [Chloroflexi bacterium]|nr:hypothetical protein [Chloroflexota bacterium]
MTLSHDDVVQIISEVEHPEIACGLVELGMVHQIEFKPDAGEVTLVLATPVMNIPQQVRDYMIASLYHALQAHDIELTQVGLAVMSESQRQQFFAQARANWRDGDGGCVQP